MTKAETQNLADNISAGIAGALKLAGAVTERELFRQFLDTDVIEHTHTGKVFSRMPARNFLFCLEDETLSYFLEQTAEYASEDKARSLEVLQTGIERLKEVTGNLETVAREFYKVWDEQEISCPGDAPANAAPMYRSLDAEVTQ